jgi:hypothetical protein
MKCPRKIYLIVSRKAKSVTDIDDVCFDRATAEIKLRVRLDESFLGADDWRIEPYPKGD